MSVQVGWPTALATSDRRQFAVKVRVFADMLLTALTIELPCPDLPWLPADRPDKAAEPQQHDHGWQSAASQR